MPLYQGDFFPMAFTSKDKYVIRATGTQDMVVERLLWRTGDLIESACDSLGNRNLTSDEWKEFSKRAPPKTCPPPPTPRGH